MPNNLSALYIIIFMLLFACNKGDEQLHHIEGLSVSFDTSVHDDSQTRVTVNNWDSDDRIGVYAIQNESTTTQITTVDYYDNFSFSTTGNGKFYHDEEPIYYPKDGSAIDFIAYYPYQPNLVSYNYPIDINNQHDFLYSKNLKNASSKNRDNTLIFNRVLSKLSLIVESEADFTVEINGVKTKATFSLANGKFSIDSASIGKLHLTPLDVDNRGLKQIECYLIPTSKERSIVVSFILNNKASYKWTIPHALERGKYYSYKLKFNDASINIGDTTNNMETFDVFFDK